MIDFKQGDFYQEYPMLKKESFDLILTDPPYGALKDLHQWDKAPEWDRLEEMFYSLLAPYGQVILFAYIHNLAHIKSVLGKRLTFRTYHIWRKPGGMPVSDRAPIVDVEFILVFRRKEDRVSDLAFNPNPLGEVGIPYVRRGNQERPIGTRLRRGGPSINVDGIRWPRVVIDAPSKPNMPKQERTAHPTQKPLSLVRKLLCGYSKPGAHILDPFAGSGTTLVASHLENRSATGFEIYPKYFQEASERLDQVTSQTMLFRGEENS